MKVMEQSAFAFADGEGKTGMKVVAQSAFAFADGESCTVSLWLTARCLLCSSYSTTFGCCVLRLLGWKSGGMFPLKLYYKQLDVGIMSSLL